MSLPWSAQQIEWLQAMGLEVLRTRDLGPAAVESNASTTIGADTVPTGLQRAARGIDLAPLLAAIGIPRDVASRRTFWRALRPLRKASRLG